MKHIQCRPCAKLSNMSTETPTCTRN